MPPDLIPRADSSSYASSAFESSWNGRVPGARPSVARAKARSSASSERSPAFLTRLMTNRLQLPKLNVEGSIPFGRSSLGMEASQQPTRVLHFARLSASPRRPISGVDTAGRDAEEISMRPSQLNVLLLALLSISAVPASSTADNRVDYGVPSVGGEWNTYSVHSGAHSGTCSGDDSG